MVDFVHHILCVTNNYANKEQLRSIFISHKQISFLFISNIADAILRLQSNLFVLVIVDDTLSINNFPLFEQLLNCLTSLCINQSTLVIVPRLTNESFDKYIKLGFTYIADMHTTRYFLPAVLKHLGEFKSQRPTPEKISHKGLILDTQSHYIVFKNCKIPMLSMWIVILHFLMKQDHCCDILIIQRYLEMIFERPISQSCITANIHRLTKRVKDVTGLEIIKNRYGVGYYLVL